MVAYNFKRRFVEPIRAGLRVPNNFGVVPPVPPKRQTIRADRERHARPGEELQLYCGMRTKGCFLIGRALCVDVRVIGLSFCPEVVSTRPLYGENKDVTIFRDLDAFARADGFPDWAALVKFWRREHPEVAERYFVGRIITWEPLP